MKKRKNKILFYYLLISITIASIIQITGIVYLDPIDEYDSKEYINITRSLLNGDGFAITKASFRGFEKFKGEKPTRIRQPLYPLYLTIFLWLFGENILIVQTSQIILNIFSLVLIFLIAQEAYKEKLWPGTLIGLGLYFPLWLTSTFILSETLFIFLLVVSMFFLQRVLRSKESLTYFVFSGLFFALAFLTRPNVLPIAFLSFFLIFLYMGIKKALKYWGVVIITFCIVISPWFIRNIVSLGDYTPLSTNGGYNIWRVSISDKKLNSSEFRTAVQDGYYKDREANKRFYKMALKHIYNDPISYLKLGLFRVAWTWSYFPGSQLYRKNNTLFFIFTLTQFSILALALIGLLKIDKLQAAYFFLPAASLSFTSIFTVGISRYIVPAMPFILILSGQGICILINIIFKKTD